MTEKQLQNKAATDANKFGIGYDVGIGIGFGIGGFGFGTGPGCGIGFINNNYDVGYGAGWRGGLALGPALPIGFNIRFGTRKIPIVFGLVLGPAIGYGTQTKYRMTNNWNA
mmetsp:Transcript_29082/g.35625  ORF Transcript_29082/g.35625 Transcript_29082/m.35625 type:complete len:111 (-) Transcript_29082:27-359(-)